MQTIVLTAVCALSIAQSIRASQIVVPNSYGPVVGGSNQNGTTRQFDRTWQGVIAASELGGLSVGDQITGLNWRAFSSTQAASWPLAGGASWTNFDVYLSSAATTPATMSNSFALNEGADRVEVRSGAYSIAAGAYTNNQITGTVSPWGPTIDWSVPFGTPFTYNGGGLTLTIRHTGNAQATSFFLDALATTNPDWGTRVAARAASGTTGTNYTATTGTSTSFLVTQFQVTPAPAPSSLALLGIAGLATRARRRRR